MRKQAFTGQMHNKCSICSSQNLKTKMFQNPDVFVWISNGVWQNGGHLFGFQMFGLPDFRSYSKSRPYSTQPLFDHSKSRLLRILDPHYTGLVWYSNPTKHNLFSILLRKNPRRMWKIKLILLLKIGSKDQSFCLQKVDNYFFPVIFSQRLDNLFQITTFSISLA